MKKYLEAGRLTSARGLKGELRFDCWCDGPEFLSGVARLYLDEKGENELEVEIYRPSIPSFIFRGFDSREKCVGLAGKVVYFDRSDVELPDGRYYNDDLIGLPVFNDADGSLLGTLTAVDTNGYRPLYTVSGEHNYLIPAIKPFLVSIDLETGIRMNVIEGLETS